jgi:hypothetical protein
MWDVEEDLHIFYILVRDGAFHSSLYIHAERAFCTNLIEHWVLLIAGLDMVAKISLLGIRLQLLSLNRITLQTKPHIFEQKLCAFFFLPSYKKLQSHI